MLTSLLLAICLQTKITAPPGQGVISLAPDARIRLVAIGDSLDHARAPWGPDGKLLDRKEVVKLWVDGGGSAKDLEAEKSYLHKPSNIRRWLLFRTDYPMQWMVMPDRLRESNGSNYPARRRTSNVALELQSIELPKGTKTFSYPFMVVPPKRTTVFDFNSDGPKQVGDVSLEVRSHENEIVTVTKSGKATFPLTEYYVRMEISKELADKELDLEAPGAAPINTDKGEMPMMHGRIDQQDLGNGRFEVVMEVTVPGKPLKGQKLRLVRKDLIHAVFKDLPMNPIGR